MHFLYPTRRALRAIVNGAVLAGGLVAPCVAQTAAQGESRIPDSVRERQTITNDSDTVARVDNEPLDPSLKGFFDIPNTSTRLRISGLARLDVIHDFSPIGSTDDFVVATIPTEVVTGADNTRIHARQTRVNLELRRATNQGDLRIVFENDFFGDGGERAFNLRHAYGQVANILGGFTVSTLADPDARPDTLDYESPPARVSARHAQLRYTVRLPARQSLAFAVEDPKTDVLPTVNGQPVTTRNPWPDGVARYRLDARQGHLQIGSVFRSIGGFAGAGAEAAEVFGGGVVTSGSLLLRRDSLVFESTVGKGVSRYVKDTSGQGLDAAVDENGQLRALPLLAALVGFQRVWSGRVRSTISGSIIRLSNEVTQPSDTYHVSQYLTANVLYTTESSLTFGVEVDYGRLTTVENGQGSAIRAQFAVQYALVR